jgi:hypothetical protein
MKEIQEILQLAKTYMIMQYFTFGCLFLGYIFLCARYLYPVVRRKFFRAKPTELDVDVYVQSPVFLEHQKKQLAFEQALEQFKPVTIYVAGETFLLNSMTMFCSMKE